MLKKGDEGRAIPLGRDRFDLATPCNGLAAPDTFS